MAPFFAAPDKVAALENPISGRFTDQPGYQAVKSNLAAEPLKVSSDLPRDCLQSLFKSLSEGTRGRTGEGLSAERAARYRAPQTT
jgi:hypothetical protein